MTNIKQLPDNVQLVITTEDLKVFALTLIHESNVDKEKAERERNTLLTTKKAAELLDVTLPTLWRWGKIGALVPVKIGSKNRYRLSDINRILNEGV